VKVVRLCAVSCEHLLILSSWQFLHKNGFLILSSHVWLAEHAKVRENSKLLPELDFYVPRILFWFLTELGTNHFALHMRQNVRTCDKLQHRTERTSKTPLVLLCFIMKTMQLYLLCNVTRAAVGGGGWQQSAAKIWDYRNIIRLAQRCEVREEQLKWRAKLTGLIMLCTEALSMFRILVTLCWCFMFQCSLELHGVRKQWSPPPRSHNEAVHFG